MQAKKTKKQRKSIQSIHIKHFVLSIETKRTDNKKQSTKSATLETRFKAKRIENKRTKHKALNAKNDGHEVPLRKEIDILNMRA